MDARSRLEALLAERIVVLDGSWGVLLQSRGLTEEQFRGERFAGHDRDVKGNPDLLNLTRPDVVRDIHRAYFDGRRRHHHDQHLHGHDDRPGRLRPRRRSPTT